MFAVKMRDTRCHTCTLFKSGAGCYGELGIAVQQDEDHYLVYFPGKDQEMGCRLWDNYFDRVDNPPESLVSYMNFLSLRGQA